MVHVFDRTGTPLHLCKPGEDDDLSFAPDGSLAVLTSTRDDYPTPFPVPPSHRPAHAISLFDSKGAPVRTLDFTAGKSFHHIAYGADRLVATRPQHPPHPFVYILTATGDPVGVITIDAFVGRDDVNPRPFLVNGGTEILIIDLTTARVFRYEMPK